METIIQIVQSILGMSPEASVAAMGVVVAVANIIGKLIPDTSTGVLAGIRRIAKIIGLYVTNRETPNDEPEMLRR